MHVILNPFGSAGDVHPFVGLGLGLRDRGHRVTFLVNPYFRPLLERLGFESIDLGTTGEFLEAMRDPDLWHPRRGFSVVCRGILQAIPISYEAIASHYVPGETVVVTSTLGLGARVASEVLGIPTATVHLQPGVFRSIHETPVYPGLRLGKAPKLVKRLFFRVMDDLMVDPKLAPELNAFRSRFGLPPVRRLMDGWWHSPHLVLAMFPDWYAACQPDWPAQTRLVGFPLYDERGVEPLPPEVERFLDEGEPPIVFTPGSANLFGRDFFASSAEACRRLGKRGLLLTRHPEQVPADLPPGVRHFSYVPFSELLPRASALVHHGGIGTMSQALAAGIPQLIRPLGHDQFDNADRIRRLGVGDWLTPKQYPSKVATTLQTLLNTPEVAVRCREVAGRFQDVDPLGEACRLVEGLPALKGNTVATG